MDFGWLLTIYVLLLLMVIRCSPGIASKFNSTYYTKECYKVLNSSSESLYSPDYPNAAPLSSKCTWQLNAKPGKFLAIQSMEINVGGSDWDCTLGYLEIFDGCDNNKFLVDKICSSRYQNTQTYLWVSTVSCVTIQFNSARGAKNTFYLKTRHTTSSCNAVFYGIPNGTFPSPLSSPSEKKECTWVVAVPRNHVELQFLGDFHITGNNLACNKDNLLTVQNGKFSSSSILGTFCGHTRPYPIYSSTNEMRITFKSSESLAGGNIFTGHYKMVDSEPSIRTNFCDSPIMMNKPHGSFISPCYPAQYPAFLKCVWLIQVKSDLKILLRFKDFDVEGDHEKCQDYVEIFDGLASWSPILRRHCGRDIPHVIRSDSNKLRVVFTTDSRKYAGRGFDAVYSQFDLNAANASSTRSHFTGIMIGTTCGIIFIVLSVLAVFHARKRRLRRALQQRSDMASTMSFDIHQANAPPSYELVMASPNMFPTPKGDSEQRALSYESLPNLHHEVCHLLGSNPDSDEDEPPPAYPSLFGDEDDVHAYGPLDGRFTVEYHRNLSQEEFGPGRVWQRQDLDQSQSSIYLPGSRMETIELPKETGTRPTLERQDTCSSFVTDV